MGAEVVGTDKKDPPEKPKVRLSFPEKCGVMPEGFDGLGINEDVEVTIKGKVTRITENAEAWDPGKELTVEIKACKIKGPAEKAASMDTVIKGARKKI